MKKVYVTGDIHGDVRVVKRICKKLNTDTSDTLILLGDVGINYFFNERDTKAKKILSTLPITIFAVRGNHEARPSRISNIQMKKYWDGNVYYEETYPNILYAIDCELYDIPLWYEVPDEWGDRWLTPTFYKTIVMGGAYSVDKYYRLRNGWSWFADEQLTEEEKQLAADNFDKYRIDIVLTHTCPFSYMPTDLFLSQVDQSMVDNSQERFFQELEYTGNYQAWLWGHYHADRNYPQEDGKYRLMLFHGVIDLAQYMEIGEFIQGEI